VLLFYDIVTVAERVVMNSPHTVMGQKLDVTLADDEPPEQEATNLVLKNVPPGTDVDFLELYMDSVTGLSASDDDYEILEKSGGLYMVVFKSTTGKTSSLIGYIFCEYATVKYLM